MRFVISFAHSDFQTIHICFQVLAHRYKCNISCICTRKCRRLDDGCITLKWKVTIEKIVITYKVSPFLQIKFKYYSSIITVPCSTFIKVHVEFLDCKIVVIVKQTENVIIDQFPHDLYILEHENYIL